MTQIKEFIKVLTKKINSSTNANDFIDLKNEVLNLNQEDKVFEIPLLNLIYHRKEYLRISEDIEHIIKTIPN